jgi:Kyakuja-Dileera-Zisupton transposase
LHDGLEEEPRVFRSSYYIPESDVDRFKNNVKTRAPKKVITQHFRHMKTDDYDNNQPTAAGAPGEQQALVVDGDKDGSTCTDRWQAAMANSLKRMWSVFRESGIFASACRHGCIGWIVDMVDSGEL